MNSDDDFISIEVIYQAETRLAMCVREDEDSEDVWLPLSQIRRPRSPERGDAIEIQAPEWLLLDKGLI